MVKNSTLNHIRYGKKLNDEVKMKKYLGKARFMKKKIDLLLHEFPLNAKSQLQLNTILLEKQKHIQMIMMLQRN